MDAFRGVEVVVFDVLGTLVDEHRGLRAAMRDAVATSGGASPSASGRASDGASGRASGRASVGELLGVWQRHVDLQQRHMAEGRRAYAGTDVVDAEAARRVAGRAGLTDPAVIARLATAGRRLPPWDDSVAGLDRLARQLPVLALSNAARTALLHLSARAGLRWHQALSGESVGAYKPAPEVYQLAVDTAGCPPERVLMVATHAWDLRGARACGLRTAYVRRPAGDPPAETDAFDGRFDTLDDLVTALTAGRDTE
ncbi:haloacid dehalogenase type II [Streptomyces lycii]|uniref:Haloacid dehalogenase type II n=1 Tax=Streptomyces lycii TaxID=2654337 RepID=A0ABQ7FML5_9ACTN|nr:haloacid dehalogenase type II [Streptomyces lycii]KAF4408473.1 haloacid dehalogenase type II [Streptomyces lycii]